MIKIEGLRKSFGAVEVLKGISTEFEAGKVACIIGPSGSGKSTFLRCINGLEVFSAGQISVDGRPVEPKKGSINLLRRDVAMVFQRFNLFPHRTAIENVIEGPVYVKGEDRAAATARGMQLLAEVGLEGHEHKYPPALSGGQQQRVAIARSLAMQPSAILFDEPTSALDPELVGEVLDVIRRVAATGKTLLIVTHEIQFAREVADRVLFIDGGNIVEEGHPSEILANPKQPRTQDFLRRVSH